MLVIDDKDLLLENPVSLEQQAEIYRTKGIQDALSHLTVFSYHLILIALKQEPEILCQLVETIIYLCINWDFL